MKLHKAAKSLAVGITATLATVAMLSASAQAAILNGNVLLSDLLAGNSYQLGDKLFDNFRDFSTVNFGNATGPQSNQIAVFGEIVDSAYNLVFQSPFWTVSENQAIDTTFKYDVTVLDPKQWITKVDLELDIYGVSHVGNPFITIVDTVDLLDPGTGSVNLLATSVSPFDSVIEDLNPHQKKISVGKDIAVVANGGFASISVIKQSVHQTRVPESSTLLGLFALAGIGLTVTRKRLKTTVISAE
ncbi:PEP-CTERM sorting domain-containing protein [Anabaena sp. UHCC 0451]|uniref:PEP-CTERM sorting domain-containing protein n=1 Tax=Anabaena sp. UHCC 0451 TaxID=2055235 RepID=UPI002B20F95B|nr:PEP-CTERM sorting domain-containing protein [Anabaena sp. UHCC 0451]MEA5575121.1 PEP-CTERM sorting domain-containing protein [Anabaena sp. UHCC 0451]